MKTVLLTMFISFFAASATGQISQPACGSFKSGEFAYRDSSNNIIHVTRKGNRQQEEDTKNKIVSKFKIRWNSECEYELTQTWSSSKLKRKQNRSVTRVVITKTNGNDSYEYHCACKDREDKSSNGTMVRLSE
jgi:hypothetical protein